MPPTKREPTVLWLDGSFGGALNVSGLGMFGGGALTIQPRDQLIVRAKWTSFGEGHEESRHPHADWFHTRALLLGIEGGAGRRILWGREEPVSLSHS